MFRVTYPEKMFETKALRQIAQACQRAVMHPGSITAIIGEVGVGKSTAVYNAMGTIEEAGVHVIWISQPEKELLRVGGIMAVIIRHFGEDPRRYIESRTEQLRRILGIKTQEDKPICVMIDEAHALGRETLRALKRVLELGFGRRMGLLSIILVAQPELYEKLRTVPEINLRTRKIEMPRFTDSEAENYCEWVAGWEGVKIEPPAIKIICRKLHNPLRIASIITQLAEICESVGEKKITAGMCKDIWTKNIRTQMDQYGITHKELADAAGYSRSAVTMMLAGQYPGNQNESKLNEALEDLVASRAGKGA
jgi:type II secretory pathway predicted ATPase ExeA